MNSKSRTENVIKNVSINLICRCIDFFVNFIVRIIFVRLLGEEILGINGLFTNILTWLSLADLGFGTAMSFSFYKPLSEKDEFKLAALTQFYRNIYLIIMAVILIVGLSLVPFLDFFVKTENVIPNLSTYYIILLLNTTFSYLFIYKSSILRADQNSYILSICSTIFNVLKSIVQLIILIYYKDYRLFLIIQVLFTILSNLYTSYIANKKYPFLHYKSKLSKGEKKSIYQNVTSVLLYKISGTILNSTDNILISMIVGTVYVGYYSNYLFAINSILVFVGILFSSMYGSLGNLLNDKNKQKNTNIFYSLLYLGYFVGCVTSACFISGFNDYIRIFFGSQYLLGNFTMLAIVFNFYLSCICQPIWTFRETAGMFKKVKYIMVITAIANLLLSIALGYLFSVFGIVLATVISRLFTYFWYEPMLLFNNIFKSDLSFYFKKILYYFTITILSLLPSFIIMNIDTTNIFLLIIKVLFSCISSIAIFVFFTRNDQSLYYIKENFFSKLRKKFKV